jgi:hypothetical protein
MVRAKGGATIAKKPVVQMGEFNTHYLRSARMLELDSEFKKQTRRLARMIARMQKSKHSL